MTNSGVKEGLDLSRLGVEEEQIAKKFARLWFISFVRRDGFKNSNFPFCFAKPTSNLMDDFHLEREVLVLFIPICLDDRA